MCSWNESGLAFFWFWGHRRLWPQTEKKTSPDPFCCSKALCKRTFVSYHLLHVSLPCFTVVSRMCIIALFNHKPNLIVKRVNGQKNWSGPLFNGSGPGFFCSVNGTIGKHSNESWNCLVKSSIPGALSPVLEKLSPPFFLTALKFYECYHRDIYVSQS